MRGRAMIRRGWVLPSALVFVVAAALTTFFLPRVWALNKVSNYAFTGNATGWTVVNSGAGIDGCGATSQTARNAWAQFAYNSNDFRAISGTGNSTRYKGYIHQQVTVPGAGNTNVVGSFYYTGTSASWRASNADGYIRLDLFDATNATFVANLACQQLPGSNVAGATVTGAVVGVTPGTYTLRVTLAYRNNGTTTATLTVDNIMVNSAPTGLSASPVAGTTSANLAWTASGTVSGPNLRAANPYQVYRGASSGGETALAFASTNSYDDSSPTGNTTYYYQVTDLDVGVDGTQGNADDNESPRSTEVSVLTCPGVPTGINFTGVTDTSITVNWTAPTGGSPNYRVERAPDVSGSPGAWAEVATGVSATNWTDNTVSCATLYWYRVRGYNASGNGAYSSQASQATAACATTTVGNGLTAEPAASTLCPGDAITDLDNFTLRTSAGTDSVTALTVTLGPAGAFDNIGSVAITSDDGATTYGTVSNPASNTVTFSPLSTSISVNTTETQYHVRIAPKSHAAMPAVPGASYATTGTVTDITCSKSKSLGDSSSGTKTVDNASVSNATWGTITPGDTQIVLNWTNPADADFSQVVILRSTATISDVPTEGATYAQGNTIGSSTVRYVGALQTFTDTGLTNGQNYYYRIFAKDACGNYSQTGTETGPHTPSAPTLTVGDGTNPGNASLCPGGAATMMDAFTLQTSAGTDTVTAVSVTFSAGTAAGLSLVEITNDAGGTVYGSQANPADLQTVALSTNITATTTLTQYKVRVTPKSHAAMPAPPGSSYAVVGTVTALTSSLSKSYGDSASSTVTVDNASPANPSWGSVTPGDTQVALNWTNPGDADFSQVVILRSTATISDVPTEGATYAQGNTIGSSAVRYVGNLQTFTDTGLTNGQAYYYKIFAKDSCGNYSTGTETGPHTPTGPTTATIRANCKDASDPGDWTWTGTELADQNDGTFALTTTNNGVLRACFGESALYNCKTITNVRLYVRASQTTGNEEFDFGLRSGGADYFTGTRQVPPGASAWADYFIDYATPPWGGSWTYTDVDALIGIAQAYRTNPWAGQVQVSEMWAVVTYTAVPTCNTTTVGSGANPGNTTVCPSGSATMLDAFTLKTDSGTDTVTSATVSFAAGTAAALSLVEITSDDGATVYGSQANPADTQAVTLTSNITATTTQTQYKVRITPKTHAALGGPPGSSYAVTGTVTAIASTNAKTYGDSTSATVTVDNLSPADATWGSVSPGNNQLTINWTNPVGDFSQVVILRNTTTPVPGTPTEGATYSVPGTIGTSIIVFVGAGTNFTDTGVLNGNSYYYKVFAKDACGNYAAGAQTGPHIPAPAANNKVRPGVPSATVDGCAQITVRMPFADDDNASSTVTVKRGAAAAGPFGTTVCTGLGGASPRTCVDSTASGSSTYHYEVTFADADGVGGTNPQVIGPFTTPACAAGGTTVTSNEAVLSSCRQITVTSTFTGDGDGDGSTKVEYNTTDTWPGTTSCAAVTGPSPRQCLVTGLSPSTQYYVRVTFTDPDGVSGTNGQVLGPFTTAACGADQVAPALSVQTPADEAIIGGAEKFKVQVYDESGPVSTLTYSVDGGAATAFLAGLNGNYACGTGCGVYEFNLDTVALGLTNGSHFVLIRAVDATGNESRTTRTFTVNNRGGKAAGSGTLLRRAAGSQTCQDCHNIKSHSSQHTSSKYGNWAIDCLSCHTPHKTTNIYVVRNAVKTPNSGSKTVVFQQDDRSGGTNPQNSYLGAYDAGGAPYDDGICEVCHTRTNYYRNDASGANNHSHNQGARCVDCHKHDEGFKGAGCNGCHGAPPNKGKHGSHWQDLAVVGSSYTDTASQTTATQYLFACAKCHSGTHLDDTHAGTLADPYRVQVVFDATADPKNAAGGYASGAAQPADLGPGGKYWAWSDGTCSNLYCHSRANPLGGTDAFATVTWNQAAAVTCTSCHQGAGAATMLSPAHRLHTDPAKYTLGCVRCHSATVSGDTTVSDKRQHVDGQKDVLFDASGVNNSGGAYDGGAYTCSNTYCHSNGQDRVAPYTSGPSVAWNSTVTCRSCHAGNASAAPTMASGRHTQHVNNLTSGGGVLGVNYACANCHDTTVALASDTAITGWASHVDGDPDVSMSSGSYAAPNCTNNYCHSSGQATPEYYSMSWAGAAIDCKGCHGRHSTNAFVSQFGEPNHTNGGAGTATANSHQKHVSAATDCADCHNDTTASGTAILNGSLQHTDNTRDVAIAATWDTNGGTKTDNYNGGTKTCSSIKCHGAGSPVWGGTVYCIGCHGGASDVNNWVINDGNASVISTTEWTTVGHGKAAVGLGGANPCLYCHEDGVNHGVGTNPFRLNGLRDANGLPGAFNAAVRNGNDACLNCHGTGNSGVDPDGTGGAYALKTSTKKVDSWHYGVDHTALLDGGMRCWDCHDAHGDGSNIQMIGSDLLPDSTDAYGLGGTRAATPVVFTANSVGTDFAKTASPFDGVCNVCHTTTQHYRNNSGDGHFGGSGCTASCHRHDQAAATDAFKPKSLCNECHNAPPGTTAGRHAKHYEIATVPSSYTNLTAGTTATQYGYACAKCHTGTHFNDSAHAGTSANPYQTQVVFDTTQAPANTGGSFTQVYNDATDAGADPVQFYSWTNDTTGANGVCANLYCHSNAAPVGGTDSRPTVYWNQASGSVTCTSCHNTQARSDTANTLTNLSNAHGKHIQSTAGETGTYSYKCDECHAAVMIDNPASPWLLTSADLGDKRNHVTGTHSVTFSSSSIVNNINQSVGAYNQGPAYTCTSTYCHSLGTATTSPFDAPNSNVAWNATATCTTCHSGDASQTNKMGTTNGSAKHANHINNAAVIGTNYTCDDCHGTVVSGNTTLLAGAYALHVNGVKNVAMSTGTYAAPNCTNNYCHSSGQATPQYYSVSWTGAALDCKGCHGNYSPAGFTSGFGEPNYASGAAGSATANSHQAHVNVAADCAICHQSTTTNGTAIASGSTLHTDGLRQVTWDAARSGATYTVATKSCSGTGSACHGAGSPQWGGTVTCRSCHMGTGAGDQDVDNWVYGNGTIATIDGEDWYAYGHGATAAFTESGNTAPNFDSGNPGTRDGCLYCHTTTVAHNAAANPFRLANVGAGNTVALKNGVCTVCHGGAGYNPGSGLIDAPDNIDAYHYGTDHAAAGGDGGMFCWDCHDPHGDYNYGVTQRLAYMIDETPTEDHGGAITWGEPTTLASTPDFRNNRDGTAGWAYLDYVATTTSGGTYRGVCQVCHDNTAHFRKSTLQDSGTHYNSGSPRCTASCHTHDQPPSDAFKPAGGGDCLGCHQNNIQGTRRAVGADFTKQSHHVGNGGTYMGGTLTNFDCVVCHAEGTVTAGATETTASHNDGAGAGGKHRIDLRSADNVSTVYSYDKDALGTPDPATWHSGNATWVAQTANLDTFCLTCHDSAGATASYTLGDSGASAMNPFADTRITNEYDQVTRNPGGFTNGRITDIASRVVAGAGDLEGGAEPRTPDGRPDPPQGIYSRHAIRNKSVSVYGGTNANWDTASYWNRSKVTWASNSVMGCADCHTVDGANTTSGNAHGSNSEYLLKDASGTATEGTLAGDSYNCYLCHLAAHYSDASNTHTGNTADYTDYTGNTGTARTPTGNTGGNIYAMACTNCHGGARNLSTDNPQFGTIHGTSQVFGIGQNGGSGNRQAYRFTNGNSMRYYDPNGWTGAVTVTCYTLGSGDVPYGGCTKHSKGGSFTRPTPGQRPLKY